MFLSPSQIADLTTRRTKPAQRRFIARALEKGPLKERFTEHDLRAKLICLVSVRFC